MRATHLTPGAVPIKAGDRAGGSSRLRPLALAGAMASAAVAWTLITQVGGVDLRAPAFQGSGPSTVGLAQVVAASGLATLAAWGVVALFERRLGHSRRMWLTTAGAGFLLTLAGPLSGTGVSATDRAFLVVLHAVVAVVVTCIMYRSLPTTEATR